MKELKLFKADKSLIGKILLTGSKSESNRALIIQAMYPDQIMIVNLSEADDTVILQKALKNLEHTIDIGPAGTAMRFLTAFLILIDGQIILTGSDRMKNRPIGPLVESLHSIGAQIEYVEKTGFPPLKITGGNILTSNKITIDGSISSQYLSACLLIASRLPDGLELVIENELTSKPYLQMTLELLNECGIEHTWKNNVITILRQEARTHTIYVEPDWSAASYWYSIVALSESGEIFLPGLKEKSLQGDSEIVKIMQSFGVETVFNQGGILITKGEYLRQSELYFDFKSCPDLAQTVIVCAAALGQNLRFTGVETLKIKETDRIAALQKELRKIGSLLIDIGDGIYVLDNAQLNFPEKIKIKTYEDHRMAMAFAPLALRIKELTIQDPMVVGKSYPDFWKDLGSVGFKTLG